MALDLGRGSSSRRHCHVTRLDVDLSAEGSDITRIAAAASVLLLGFSDGHVTLFQWSPSAGFAEAPMRLQAWQLATPPSALAVPTAKGRVEIGFAGTQAGCLMRVELQQEKAVVLSTAHAGSPITALLCQQASGREQLQTSSLTRFLFSADANGRVFRCNLAGDTAGTAVGDAATQADHCADLRSPVLALELCERASRLLISTTERIAIIDDVLSPSSLGDGTGASGSATMKMRWVGSKPHKGQFTASISRTFGPEALIAARPGGRLWVAEGATGTVQSTLKFQSAVGEDKAALARLIALDHHTVASWARSEGANDGSSGDGAAVGTTVVLLDLEAIAVSHEWSLAPVVDAASWGGGRLLIAHRHTVSLLLMADSPEAMMRTLLAGTANRLVSDRPFLAGCLQEANALVQVTALPTCEAMQCLRPLVEAVATLEDSVEILSEDDGLTEDVLSTFKACITELEDKEEAEAHTGRDQLVHSLVMSPLANFPIAEGSGSVTNPSASSSCSRTRDAAIEAVDIGWVFGRGSLAAKASRGEENGFVTPQLLSRCHQLLPVISERPAVKAESPPSADAIFPPPPEAGGAILRVLGITPFRSSIVVLQYFAAILQWLVVVLDSLPEDGASSVTSVAAPASHAFELLCLHVERDRGADAGSAWPRLGVAPEEEALASLVPPHACPRSELAAHLRTVANAANAAAESGTSSTTEPWAACASSWIAGTALAFCEVFFCAASVSLVTLDRCLLRANGLAAQGQGWPAVVRWLRNRTTAQMPCASLSSHGQEAWNAWSAAFHRVEEAARAPEPGAGTVELHACLEAALGAAGRPGALGRRIGPGWAARARETFGLALSSFPKVLPWNVAQWIRCALGAEANVPGEAAQPGLLASELVQYLLRLLPTCARWPDFGGLLHGALTAALHGELGIAAKGGAFLARRNTVADSLIDRYMSLLTAAQLSRLRYPLGVLRLLNGGDAVASVNDEAFETSISATMNILEDVAAVADQREGAHTASESTPCPMCAPHGRTCADSLARRRLANETVRASEEVAPLQSGHLGRQMRVSHVQEECEAQTLGFTPSSSSLGTPMCITRGDLELSQELKKLCGKSDVRRRRLLDVISSKLTKDAAGSAKSMAPFERLLVAFAHIDPEAELTALALSAAMAGTLSASAAAAMAHPLWKAAGGAAASGGGGVSPAGMDVREGTLGSEPRVSLPLPLPSPRRPPPPPTPPSPPRRQVKTPLAPHSQDAALAIDVGVVDSSITGFARNMDKYIDISGDGLYARHKDDTGELMHGVVLSEEPLSLTGRVGFYFEIELVEVRAEEMPDGLTVGVTLTDPESIQDIPETAEHIPDTWAAGYDGQIWDAQTGGLSRVDWDPRSLASGDLIGVLVTLAEGELLVFHNGVACCPGPRGIPVEPSSPPLYAVVDLLGAARAVRWRPRAEPPIGG